MQALGRRVEVEAHLGHVSLGALAQGPGQVVVPVDQREAPEQVLCLPDELSHRPSLRAGSRDGPAAASGRGGGLRRAAAGGPASINWRSPW
jgi:hypothetical protein